MNNNNIEHIRIKIEQWQNYQIDQSRHFEKSKNRNISYRSRATVIDGKMGKIYRVISLYL